MKNSPRQSGGRLAELADKLDSGGFRRDLSAPTPLQRLLKCPPREHGAFHALREFANALEITTAETEQELEYLACQLLSNNSIRCPLT